MAQHFQALISKLPILLGYLAGVEGPGGIRVTNCIGGCAPLGSWNPGLGLTRGAVPLDGLQSVQLDVGFVSTAGMKRPAVPMERMGT